MQPWQGDWGLPEPLSGEQWAPPGNCLSRSPPGAWGWVLQTCWVTCQSHQRWSKIPSLDTQRWNKKQEVNMILTTFILKNSYLKKKKKSLRSFRTRLSSVCISTIITACSYGLKTMLWKGRPEKPKVVKMSGSFFLMGSKGRLRKNEVYLCVLIRNNL